MSSNRNQSTRHSAFHELHPRPEPPRRHHGSQQHHTATMHDSGQAYAPPYGWQRGPPQWQSMGDPGMLSGAGAFVTHQHQPQPQHQPQHQHQIQSHKAFLYPESYVVTAGDAHLATAPDPFLQGPLLHHQANEMMHHPSYPETHQQNVLDSPGHVAEGPSSAMSSPSMKRAKKSTADAQHDSDSASSTGRGKGSSKASPSKNSSPSKHDLSLKKQMAVKSPMTISWLLENYEEMDGVSLPRSSVYEHYLEFCSEQGLTPVNAASFGKMIRSQFPNLRTRRLGTRGQSKYHYYGIGIKATSKYRKKMADVMITDASSQARQIVPEVVLPPFPPTPTEGLPEDLPISQLRILMGLYRKHGQLLLQCSSSREFKAISEALVRFWTELPSNLRSLCQFKLVIDLLSVCDDIIYRTIMTELIPSISEALPADVVRGIRGLAREWIPCIETALEGLPGNFQAAQRETAGFFVRELRRQTSLNHLSQAAQAIFESSRMVRQMLHDWNKLDFRGMYLQARMVLPASAASVIDEKRSRFQKLLESNAPLKSHIDWLIESVNRAGGESEAGFMRRVTLFLVAWNLYTNMITRELRVRNANSFSSFHLLKLLFDEYIIHLLEKRAASRHSSKLRQRIGLEGSRGSGASILEAVAQSASLHIVDPLDVRSDISQDSAPRSSAMDTPLHPARPERMRSSAGTYGAHSSQQRTSHEQEATRFDFDSAHVHALRQADSTALTGSYALTYDPSQMAADGLPELGNLSSETAPSTQQLRTTFTGDDVRPHRATARPTDVNPRYHGQSHFEDRDGSSASSPDDAPTHSSAQAEGVNFSNIFSRTPSDLFLFGEGPGKVDPLLTSPFSFQMSNVGETGGLEEQTGFSIGDTHIVFDANDEH